MPIDAKWGATSAYQSALPHFVEGAEKQAPEWVNWRVLRDQFVWTMAVVKFPKGPWEVTAANWQEIYRRIHIYERTDEAMRVKNGEPQFFTPAEIHSLIGFAVNAGNSTEAEFNKLIKRETTRVIERTIRRFEDGRGIDSALRQLEQAKA